MYEDIKKQFKDLEARLSSPEIISDVAKLTQISKKHACLKPVYEYIVDLEKIKTDILDSEEMLKEHDEEIKKMAEVELNELKTEKEKLKKLLNDELNPADPNNKKNIIMEIRAGTGGDESALFAAELFRMYSRYAENNKWKVGMIDNSPIGIGGFKEVTFEIKGKNVFKHLKYEAGTHRVQRVPETEKQGRVHTSAVTVAVLAEAEEMDLEIKDADIRIDVYSASGPGGQSVNTSNSAVRITHLPTGAIAQCQDQKSQQQNKVKAMQVLRSRVLQKLEEKKQKKEAAARKSQIGSGDRSEKIRTYNFPQDRITDHRIGKNWSNMNTILDGGLNDVVESLQKAEMEINKN